MFVDTKRMLLEASRQGYAVGAFNVENAEMVWAVVAAAQELRAPVILQTTSSTLKYFTPSMFAALARSAAEETSVPVALHLDHGNSFDIAARCMESGYTSLMIDGSTLPYEDNVALTKRVCGMAGPKGIPVEAELGIVGGKEDDTHADANHYTDPVQAADFVKRTGVTSLAISIGTAHGFYAVAPVLDLSRITATRELVDIPLVLHGASGVPDETVSAAVRLGMAKVNFATELRDAYTKAVRAYLAENPLAYDPKKYGEAAREAVKRLVMHKIRLCMSEGKA